MLRRRLSLLAPSVALLAVLLVISPVLSAIRIGTNGNDTLTGTSGNDQLTGKGGDDTLKGLAGNDIYYFDDTWGTDTLEEKAGAGTDALSFAKVNTGYVDIMLIRQWGPSWNRALCVGGGCGRVNLGTSAVENATTGSYANSYDQIFCRLREEHAPARRWRH